MVGWHDRQHQPRRPPAVTSGRSTYISTAYAVGTSNDVGGVYTPASAMLMHILMTAYLKAQVRERRSRIDHLSQQRLEIERELLIAEAELRAYEDALLHYESSAEHLDKPDEAGKTIEVEKSTSNVLHMGDKPTYDRNSRINPKSEEYAAARMTPSWKIIIYSMMKIYPEARSLAEMLDSANEAGEPLSVKSIRGTAATYAARGWLERIRPGHYRPTTDGARAAGVIPHNVDLRSSEASTLRSRRLPTFA